MNDTLESLFYQAEDYFVRGISKKCLDLHDGVTVYMTGAAAADLNCVCIQKTVSSLDKILKQSKQLFDKNKLPFFVIFPENLNTDAMKNALRSIGYFHTSNALAMWLKLEDLSIEVDPNEDIVIHANSKKLNEWMIPLITAFKSNFEISSQYASAHKKALKNGIKLHHFSLYKSGKPISSITLSLHNDLARIGDVSTLPEFERRGYATRLIKHALLEAKKSGATYCFLEGYESIFSLYQKLGFKTLFKDNIYSCSIKE